MAAQREMEALIERTAISAFIREKKDFYTALFDAEGVMAVGTMVPIFGELTALMAQVAYGPRSRAPSPSQTARRRMRWSKAARRGTLL